MWIVAVALAGPPSELAGRWTYVGGAEQAAAVDALRESIASTFNVMLRPVVRARLARPMNVDDALVFTITDAAITLDYQGDQPRSATFTLADGRWLDASNGLTLREHGGAWLLEGSNDDGGMTRRFTVDGDRLTLTTTLSSPHLTTSPSWTLSFAR